MFIISYVYYFICLFFICLLFHMFIISYIYYFVYLLFRIFFISCIFYFVYFLFRTFIISYIYYFVHLLFRTFIISYINYRKLLVHILLFPTFQIIDGTQICFCINWMLQRKRMQRTRRDCTKQRKQREKWKRK
jgi:hypothetical protein